MKNKSLTNLSINKSNKIETFRQISYALFQLEESRGHMMWKVTDLARKAKVGRSTIYTYFGSSKKQIFGSILKIFLSDFYLLESQGPVKDWADILCSSHERMLQHPEAIFFYQKWRNKKSWIRDEFLKTEKQFQDQLKNKCNFKNESELLFVQTFVHGLVTAPFLPMDSTKKVLDLFLKIEITDK